MSGEDDGGRTGWISLILEVQMDVYEELCSCGAHTRPALYCMLASDADEEPGAKTFH